MIQKILRWRRALAWWLIYTKGVPAYLIKPLYCLEQYRMKRSYRVGMIVENCDYHPCIVTSIDPHILDCDIEMRSLITHRLSSCSVRHCPCKVLSPDEVFARLDAFARGGERALMQVASGWSTDEVDAFLKEWRPDHDVAF